MKYENFEKTHRSGDLEANKRRNRMFSADVVS
jgi:hypothetical protein